MRRGAWFALLGVVAAVCASVPSVAQAQSWPNRPVKIIVPYPPGGGSDLMARLVGEKLQQSLGQPFVIENRPGAAGKVGLEFAARQDADGYSFVVNPNSLSIMPILYNLTTDPVKDYTPVVMFSQAPIVIGGHPSKPIKTIKEFVDHLKANPGKESYASCGTGGLQNIAMEVLRMVTKIDILHVPYNGCGPPVPDMLSGRVPFYASVMNSVSGYMQGGELRAYAISNAKRSALLPDLPTIGETFPGVAVENWVGLFGPANVSPDIVRKLNAEINTILAMPDIRAKMMGAFIEPVGGTPEKLGDAVKSDVPYYAKLLNEIGLQRFK